MQLCFLPSGRPSFTSIIFLQGFCSCKRSLSPKNVIGYVVVVFFQTSQTKFLLNDGTWFTIAFQQNIHYYRFCSHCFQVHLIIGIFLFARATLSVSEKTIPFALRCKWMTPHLGEDTHLFWSLKQLDSSWCGINGGCPPVLMSAHPHREREIQQLGSLQVLPISSTI